LLAVLPEVRGLGIGKALVLECLARARRRGAIAVGLHTMDFMQIAQGMYERMGFVRVPEYDYRPHPEVLVKAYRLQLAK
jgi:ribosomal protein S18 acetylase RimI-like enzyme